MAKERRLLAGKVVAITGGARGIGEATARAIVAKGGKVAIGDLDVELAQKTAGVLGGDTIALELDVTRRDSFENFISQVEERLGAARRPHQQRRDHADRRRSSRRTTRPPGG